MSRAHSHAGARLAHFPETASNQRLAAERNGFGTSGTVCLTLRDDLLTVYKLGSSEEQGGHVYGFRIFRDAAEDAWRYRKFLSKEAI
jgi:hypothetical protein